MWPARAKFSTRSRPKSAVGRGERRPCWSTKNSRSSATRTSFLKPRDLCRRASLSVSCARKYTPIRSRWRSTNAAASSTRNTGAPSAIKSSIAQRTLLPIGAGTGRDRPKMTRNHVWPPSRPTLPRRTTQRQWSRRNAEAHRPNLRPPSTTPLSSRAHRQRIRRASNSSATCATRRSGGKLTSGNIWTTTTTSGRIRASTAAKCSAAWRTERSTSWTTQSDRSPSLVPCAATASRTKAAWTATLASIQVKFIRANSAPVLSTVRLGSLATSINVISPTTGRSSYSRSGKVDIHRRQGTQRTWKCRKFCAKIVFYL